MEKANAVKRGQLFGVVTALLVVAAAVSPVTAQAAIAALDVTAGTTYLETNASTNMTAIAEVLFSLAGLAVAIRWVKATFFS